MYNHMAKQGTLFSIKPLTISSSRHGDLGVDVPLGYNSRYIPCLLFDVPMIRVLIKLGFFLQFADVFNTFIRLGRSCFLILLPCLLRFRKYWRIRQIFGKKSGLVGKTQAHHALFSLNPLYVSGVPIYSSMKGKILMKYLVYLIFVTPFNRFRFVSIFYPLI